MYTGKLNLYHMSLVCIYGSVKFLNFSLIYKTTTTGVVIVDSSTLCVSLVCCYMCMHVYNFFKCRQLFASYMSSKSLI